MFLCPISQPVFLFVSAGGLVALLVIIYLYPNLTWKKRPLHLEAFEAAQRRGVLSEDHKVKA